MFRMFRRRPRPERPDFRTREQVMKIPIKVVFSNRDETLAAIIRALAVQAAGLQIVEGMDWLYLRKKGYYRFEFASQIQVDRFTESVADYLQDRWRDTIRIIPDSN
jgi:hypothetical protein